MPKRGSKYMRGMTAWEKRNQRIYEARLQGKTWEKTAQAFGLKVTTCKEAHWSHERRVQRIRAQLYNLPEDEDVMFHMKHHNIVCSPWDVQYETKLRYDNA
jgi:predicted NAD-dependent protein-ADP-ribosyltransferase YbiA (DUF1768 family)